MRQRTRSNFNNGGLAQLIRALCLHRSGLQFESAIPYHFKQVPLKSCALILSRACEPFPVIWPVQLEKSPRIRHPVGDGFHQCPTRGYRYTTRNYNCLCGIQHKPIIVYTFYFLGGYTMKHIAYYERILMSLSFVAAGVFLKVNGIDTWGNVLMTFGVIRSLW